MNYVHTIGRCLVCPLMALSIAVGGTACNQPCPIWQSGDDFWQIQDASDPSRRIPRWTDDGQWVVSDLSVGSAINPISVEWRRDNISIVDSHGLELNEWTPAEAPSPGPFYASDYAPDVVGDNVVFTTLRHACDGSKHYEIATANLDGSGYRRLTDADGSDLLPAWSPDGSKIAFVSNRIAFDDSSGISRYDRGAFNIYVMDADGSNVRSPAPDIFLSAGGYLDGYGYNVASPYPPVWSSSGWLAFRDWRSQSLYTVYPDKPRVVVTFGQSMADPAWSPDGEWIAWVDSGGTDSLFVARADGTEKRSLFRVDALAGYVGLNRSDALSLSWTPDGEGLRFIFAAREGTAYRYGLYQVGLDGSNPTLIAEVPRGAAVVWSPDGSRALVSNRTTYSSTGGGELFYTIAADGSDKRVLVRHSYDGGAVAANGK